MSFPLTEKQMIMALLEEEHQISMDGVITVQKYGFLAGDDDGKYGVSYEPEFTSDTHVAERIFDTAAEAVDDYLELVDHWLSRVPEGWVPPVNNPNDPAPKPK